jgi:hypothetical protein
MRTSLSGEMLSAWNASIASALGREESSNFSWGGSMAIRRDVFQRLNIRERWDGTLSDDFTVTKVINEAGLKIRLVPAALVPSFTAGGWRDLFEFTTRQMKITRVYASHLWKMSFVGSAVFTVVIAASIAILITQRSDVVLFWTSAAVLLLVTVFSVGKAILRFRAVKMVLPHELLNRQFWPQMTLWLFTPPVFLFNCLAALMSHRIEWRGTVYEMISATETKVVTARSQK